MNNYFNTTNQTGRVLDESRLSADGQTKQILEIFRSHGRSLAAHQVYSMMPNNWRFPISNVRRSITCLTPVYLTKTDKKIAGPYKAEVYVWELNSNQ